METGRLKKQPPDVATFDQLSREITPCGLIIKQIMELASHTDCTSACAALSAQRRQNGSAEVLLKSKLKGLSHQSAWLLMVCSWMVSLITLQGCFTP